ncbi:MAG: DNA-binding transcriptional regulator CpxR [Methanomassiliicoccales archaeon PtaU1.Bin124]|nr:MAG: DNA-binding transcriptional regulator CpxR [Methanomassiliicoccales archaeon PtaU1.Bin124]
MANILLVDDDEGLLEIGKEFLENEGQHHVTISSSVSEALTHIGVSPIDIIVSDYQMPVTDGIEFLMLMRSRKDKIPFILFTGRGREEVVIEAINHGADFYIKKGTDVRSQYAQLLHTIDQALARKQAEDAVEYNLNLFKQLLENNMDMILVVNRDIKIEYVSPSITKILGYTEDEVIGRQGLEFLNPDGLAKVEHVDVNNPQTFSSKWIIIDIQRKDGTWATIEAIAKLFERNGSKKIIINARDVSARVEKDRHLQLLMSEIGMQRGEVERRNRPGCIGGIRYSYQFGTFALTPVAATIFGIDVNGEGLSYADFLNRVHPEDRRIFSDMEAYSAPTVEPREFRFRILLNGGVRYLSSVVCSFLDEAGMPKYLQGMVSDQTEMVGLQEKIMMLDKARD